MNLYDAIIEKGNKEDSVFLKEDYNTVLKNKKVTKETKEKMLYLMNKIADVDDHLFDKKDCIRYFFTNEKLITKEGYDNILDHMYTFLVEKEIDEDTIETVCVIAQANNEYLSHSANQIKVFVSLINQIITFKNDYGVYNNNLLEDLFTNEYLMDGVFNLQKELIFDWATKNRFGISDEVTRKIRWNLLTSFSLIITIDKPTYKELISLCFVNDIMPHILDALLEDCETLTSVDIRYLYKIYPEFMKNFKGGKYSFDMEALKGIGIALSVNDIKQLSRECALFDIVREKSTLGDDTKKGIYSSILDSTYKEETARIMRSNLDSDEKEFVSLMLENTSFASITTNEKDILSLADIATSPVLTSLNDKKDLFYSVVTLAKAFTLTNHEDKLDYLKQILSHEEYKNDINKLNRAISYINEHEKKEVTDDYAFASHKMAFYYTDEEFDKAMEIFRNNKRNIARSNQIFGILTTNIVCDDRKREEYLNITATMDHLTEDTVRIGKENKWYETEQRIYEEVEEITKESLKNTEFSSSIFEKNKCKVKNTTNN